MDNPEARLRQRRENRPNHQSQERRRVSLQITGIKAGVRDDYKHCHAGEFKT